MEATGMRRLTDQVLELLRAQFLLVNNSFSKLIYLPRHEFYYCVF
jgi:hypothetical protein